MRDDMAWLPTWIALTSSARRRPAHFKGPGALRARFGHRARTCAFAADARVQTLGRPRRESNASFGRPRSSRLGAVAIERSWKVLRGTSITSRRRGHRTLPSSYRQEKSTWRLRQVPDLRTDLGRRDWTRTN